MCEFSHRLHWADKVEKEVQKPIKQGVIKRIPANEVTRLISLASFVVNNEKEEKLWLVCDTDYSSKGVGFALTQENPGNNLEK